VRKVGDVCRAAVVEHDRVPWGEMMADAAGKPDGRSFSGHV
jgi:hypothetical protein